MNPAKLFLLIAALGLTPIALAYGLMPELTVPMLYGIEINSVNTSHVFRAVMGLYLAMVVFWLIGFRRESLRRPALLSVLVFMVGLAAGRAVSLLLDGVPSGIFILYLLLEMGFALVAIALIRKPSVPALD